MVRAIKSLAEKSGGSKKCNWLTPAQMPPPPSPRTQASRTALDVIIRSCLKEYNGGKVFFEALDAQVRTKKATICLLPHLCPDTTLIVTGAFGSFFSSAYSGVFRHIYPVAGGLRLGSAIPALPRGGAMMGRDVIMVDDSLYSGKTYDRISTAAQRCGARSVRALVVYDGSPEYNDKVSSLFRYRSGQLEALLASAGASHVGTVGRS